MSVDTTLRRQHGELKNRVTVLEDRIELMEHAIKQMLFVGGQIK